MTKGRRKKPPKYDHAALAQGYVASPPTEDEARTATQAWLKVEANLERLLEAVACGQSLRRFCELEKISYAPVQRALTSDALRERYHSAQEQQAEHLLGEMDRISKALEGLDAAGNPKYRDEAIVNKDGSTTVVKVLDVMDPKIAAVLMDGIKWRLTKFNQRRYGDKQVVEQHTFDHTKAHIEAVRQLARAPRWVGSNTPPLLDQRTSPAALDHQADSNRILQHTAPVPALAASAQYAEQGAASDQHDELVQQAAASAASAASEQQAVAGSSKLPASASKLPASAAREQQGARAGGEPLEGEVIPRAGGK